MGRKNASAEVPRKSPFWSSVRILLLILLIAAVPLALREVNFDPETVKHVGRIAVGVGAVLVVIALIKQVTKIFMALAVAALAFAILVSEGVIEIPRLLSK